MKSRYSDDRQEAGGKTAARYWLLLTAFVVAWPSWAQTVIVPDDYDSIEEALAAIEADPEIADTILVERGTYQVNLELLDGVSLRGRETAQTILEPADATLPVIDLNGIDNVVVRNFTFRDGNLGVQVAAGIGITIANNVFRMGLSGTAVDVADGSPVDVINNTFFLNEIAVDRFSDAVEVQNNIFSDNATAIDSAVDTNVSFNCFFSNDHTGATGSDAVTGSNPLFVSTSRLDFHLREDSPCIDEGTGTDVIDDTVADLGVYGGSRADVFPFPPQGVTATDITADEGSFAIRVNWSENLSYRVADDAEPGGYQVYYDSDRSGPPYGGTDAQADSPVDVSNVTTYTLTGLEPQEEAPNAPQNVTVEPGNGRITVSWDTVANAASYNVYYGLGAVTENQVEAGNVTATTIAGLTNGATYQVAVSAVAQSTYYIAVTAYDNTGDADHESDYSDEVSVTLGDAQESARSATVTAIPEPVQAYPVLPDEGCFIATAAYGVYSAAQVQVLRDFRDRHLLTNRAGQQLVAWYYRNSPPAAAYIADHPAARRAVQLVLLPVIVAALFWVAAPLLAKGAVFALFAGWAGLRWRRRAGRDTPC